MTPAAGWLLLAAAALAWASPSRAVQRSTRLAAAARLAGTVAAPGAPASGPGPARPALAFAAPAALAVLLAVLLTAGVAAVVVLAAVGGCGWLSVRDAVAGRLARAGAADLVVGVEVIAGELAAGARPAAALLAAADSAPRHEATLRSAGAVAADGGDAAQELLADPRTATLGIAWRVGQDGGTALAAVLRRVVVDLRSAAEQRQAVQVALAGPRSSAVLLTGLPLVGVGLGMAMGAQPLAFLLGDPAGRAVGCVGTLLDAGGVLWMRRILLRAGEP